MPVFKDEFTKLPRFDWDRAKNFYYVAKIGSQTEAAVFLNTSQSALSRQMAALEQELKCKLISSTRSPKRRIQLTRKGEEFFMIIERAFLDLKGFNYSEKVMSRDGEKRRIRISTTHAIAAYVLSEHLIAYNEVNPNIIFEVIVNDQLIDIALNDVDMAIRPFHEDTRGIEQEPLFALEKKLFASPKYIEMYGEPQTVEDLKNHHILAHANPEKHPYADVNWILKLGMEPGEMHEPVFTSNSLECLVKAAQAGMGIIGGYDEMEIIKNSGLKAILLNVKGQKIEDYISYPQHLKPDKDFIEIKRFLLKHMGNKQCP